MRNPSTWNQKAKEFLDNQFTDNYVVVNLCVEQENDSRNELLDESIKFPIADMTAPQSIIEFHQFIQKLADFIIQEKKVVAVHCWHGRGRTGTAISCLLLQLKVCDSAEEAMQLFSQKRVGKNYQQCLQYEQLKFIQAYCNAIANPASIEVLQTVKNAYITNLQFINTQQNPNDAVDFVGVWYKEDEKLVNVELKVVDGVAQIEKRMKVSGTFSLLTDTFVDFKECVELLLIENFAQINAQEYCETLGNQYRIEAVLSPQSNKRSQVQVKVTMVFE